MNVFEEDIAEEIRASLPGTEEIIVQYISGYLLDLDDAAEDEDVLQVTRSILESATPSTSHSKGQLDPGIDNVIAKLGEMLEEPLRKRAEKNRAGNANGNGLVRLDKVMDMSKTAAMSNTVAFVEGVDLESINKGK